MSLLEYPPYGNFDALLNIWFETSRFGTKENPIPSINPNWAQTGTPPNKVLVTCYLCNPSFLATPQSHVQDYPQCLLNRFITNERFRLDRVCSTRPAAQRFYLLKDRFTTYYRSNGLVDHPFNYCSRCPDRPQTDFHCCEWSHMPAIPILPLLEDALTDEAYHLKPGTATRLRRSLIAWHIDNNGAPDSLMESEYPVYP